MIELYSKNYCPYCQMAKELLNSLKVEYKEIDITATPEYMDTLEKRSGFRTVPQIFVGDKCLGGYDSIKALHDKGELLEALNPKE